MTLANVTEILLYIFIISSALIVILSILLIIYYAIKKDNIDDSKDVKSKESFLDIKN